MRIRGTRVALLCAFGVALSGCVTTARLSERRSAYAEAFAAVAGCQGDYDARATLLQGLIQRTKTPYAAPYPELVARMRKLSADLDALKLGQAAGGVFEGDFDSFAKGESPVLSRRSEDWPRYLALDARFRSIARGLEDGQAVFDGDRDLIDALMRAHAMVHLDPTALGPTLDSLDREWTGGLKRMEERVRQVQAAVDFQKGAGGDPELLSNERDTLESMQDHLFRSGSLVRRALQLSDKVRASGPAPDGLWAGPGLPDDGSDWAKLGAMREAFRRRRAEFHALSQAFTALEASIPESIPVQ